MRERFQGLEWLKLCRLPAVIFYAVASADGRADHYEEERFLEHVTQSRPVDMLVRRVFDNVVEQGRDAIKLTDAERDYTTYVAEMGAVLRERLPEGERRSFLAGLLGLGHHVAAASGGFFGLGSKVSAAESARLEELSTALGWTS